MNSTPGQQIAPNFQAQAGPDEAILPQQGGPAQSGPSPQLLQMLQQGLGQPGQGQAQGPQVPQFSPTTQFIQPMRSPRR